MTPQMCKRCADWIEEIQIVEHPLYYNSHISLDYFDYIEGYGYDEKTLVRIAAHCGFTDKVLFYLNQENSRECCRIALDAKKYKTFFAIADAISKGAGVLDEIAAIVTTADISAKEKRRVLRLLNRSTNKKPLNRKQIIYKNNRPRGKLILQPNNLPDAEHSSNQTCKKIYIIAMIFALISIINNFMNRNPLLCEA